MFKPASKEATKLRVAIFGPSGSGKTMTALRLAKGFGGKIALIDSERRSASKYANHPKHGLTFDVCDLEQGKQSINDYVHAINEAAKCGYEVLIIDSLSHAWQELVAEVELLSKNSRHKGNTWSAWSEGTPKQKALVNAILSYPGHVIATLRSKTAWVEAEKNGRKSMDRIGLAPEQGKGIEYEFDMLIEITTEHVATFAKDRSDTFQDQNFLNPGEELGRQMVQWLEQSPAPAPAPPAPAPAAEAVVVVPAAEPSLVEQATDRLVQAGVTPLGIARFALKFGITESLSDVPATTLETLCVHGVKPSTVEELNA
jgi:hypothetical protein